MQAVSAELTDLKKTLQSQLWFFEGTSSSQRESQASGLPPAVMIISSGHHPDRAPWPQQAWGRGTACSPQGSVENIARHLHKSQVLLSLTHSAAFTMDRSFVGCITKTREATPARWSNCIEYLPFSYDPLLQNVCVLTLLLSMWWTQTQPKSARAPKGFACHFVEGCVHIKTTYLKQLLFLFCSSASEWWTGTNVTESPFPSFNL